MLSPAHLRHITVIPLSFFTCTHIRTNARTQARNQKHAIVINLFFISLVQKSNTLLNFILTRFCMSQTIDFYTICQSVLTYRFKMVSQEQRGGLTWFTFCCPVGLFENQFVESQLRFVIAVVFDVLSATAGIIIVIWSTSNQRPGCCPVCLQTVFVK